MRRILVVMFLLAMLAGCCGGPDLKPAMQEVDESLEMFEPELEAYWASDLFLKDERPESLDDDEAWAEVRKEAVETRKQHWTQMRQTIKTALNPDTEKKDEPAEAPPEEKPAEAPTADGGDE